MKNIKNILSQALYGLHEYELANGMNAYQQFTEEDFQNYVQDSFQEILPQLSFFFVDDSALKFNSESDDEFFKFHNKEWGSIIEKLERFISFSIWVGSENNEKFREVACENDDVMFDVLIKLHARASLVSNEILCLIKNGYPDAALSRWRSLYDILVIFISIYTFGPDCAERFYHHHVVDKFNSLTKSREAKEQYPDKYEYLVVDDEETQYLESLYDSLLTKYGKKYRFDYGWLEGFVEPKNKNGKVTFADIEKALSLDHYAPYSKIASQNIHASSQSLNFNLSSSSSSFQQLCVGRSTLGATIPIEGLATSMFQITSNLLNYISTEDNKIFLAMLLYHFKEIKRSLNSRQTVNNDN
ncbi:DUF5677 domain-containing protein [Pseudoalteromonas lipolytica]|uniref:Uncharacterized protein n=1 Tax=Pseudoalteromonas lipolytica TaxID=570156 RepID=A0ABY1GHV6_9GAMM|nr:DUF5677 domain-containing protein [Pseudoalteromonas lipolytica]MBE0349278.1 hypothetical protein [Pseudoalteromonas lipolytica LMEB 39]SFT74518.1 hypothetical protein SAMN04487854_108219 [Pseudoalteromonas lipolytica]